MEAPPKSNGERDILAARFASGQCGEPLGSQQVIR
jgi:hypothetical protein